MKSAAILPLLSLILVSAAALAQPVQQVVPDQATDGVYHVFKSDLHSRTWQRLVEVQDENGFLQTRTNSYEELATGMNVFSQAEQKFVEASDEIEILDDGAVARKSQHNISFSGNLNDPKGTIAIIMPHGKRLISRCIGLAFTESDTGKSAFIFRLGVNSSDWGSTLCIMHLRCAERTRG